MRQRSIRLLLASFIFAAQTSAQVPADQDTQAKIADYITKAEASRSYSEEDIAVLEVIADCAADFTKDQSCKERSAQLKLSRDFHSEDSRSNQVIDDFIKFYGSICKD